MSDAELKLWQEICQKQILGIRFRKQAPIGNYIVDFVSHEIRFIIELDGGQHNDSAQIEYDKQRTSWLEARGYKVRRFWNHEVLENLDVVLEVIWDFCHQRRPEF